jgi:hypothetical protein
MLPGHCFQEYRITAFSEAVSRQRCNIVLSIQLTSLRKLCNALGIVAFKLISSAEAFSSATARVSLYSRALFFGLKQRVTSHRTAKLLRQSEHLQLYPIGYSIGPPSVVVGSLSLLCSAAIPITLDVKRLRACVLGKSWWLPEIDLT